MTGIRAILCIFPLALLLGACAGQTEQSYDPTQEQSLLTVRHGLVTQAREVKIAGSNASPRVSPQVGVGMGYGRHGLLGGITLGILTGGWFEDSSPEREAQELTIRLEDGQEIVVVQALEHKFSHGEQVRILTAPDGKTRVQPE
jgi:outer membrane lipoprotein SlyB